MTLKNKNSIREDKKRNYRISTWADTCVHWLILSRLGVCSLALRVCDWWAALSVCGQRDVLILCVCKDGVSEVEFAPQCGIKLFTLSQLFLQTAVILLQSINTSLFTLRSIQFTSHTNWWRTELGVRNTLATARLHTCWPKPNSTYSLDCLTPIHIPTYNHTHMERERDDSKSKQVMPRHNQ